MCFTLAKNINRMRSCHAISRLKHANLISHSSFQVPLFFFFLQSRFFKETKENEVTTKLAITMPVNMISFVVHTQSNKIKLFCGSSKCQVHW
jgi:hypothetical protein